MHLEILVEERSAEEALQLNLPKILPGVSFQLHCHQGKNDLLNKLEGRLKGYQKWLPDDYRIVILLDRDDQDCLELKGRLEEMAERAGLFTKSHPNRDGAFQVLNRLAVEELEAWFLGDLAAIQKAYPRVRLTGNRISKYRRPDSISGGTWEAMERLLQKAGYYAGGLPKIEAARNIARHMNPVDNSSVSF
jgi:hypothetical protein